ncbi:hypothetical protein TYRP_005109 [Tyrophagus putrescentiae]|nr:hypothetical protein TYRP_005109 [Tyrophagus putrescentiae]
MAPSLPDNLAFGQKASMMYCTSLITGLLSPQGDTTLLPLPLSLLCMIKLKGLKCSLPPPYSTN